MSHSNQYFNLGAPVPQKRIISDEEKQQDADFEALKLESDGWVGWYGSEMTLDGEFGSSNLRKLADLLDKYKK
jgi:hypothetical protein